MYNINFYKDEKENEPVKDYLKDLSAKNDKNNRIKLNKIQEYIEVLKTYGTRIGEPYVKHIEGDIWELRPLKDRIFFIGVNGNSFLLLHYFAKKTQKTPKREIEIAKKYMTDYLERSKKNE